MHVLKNLWNVMVSQTISWGIGMLYSTSIWILFPPSHFFLGNKNMADSMPRRSQAGAILLHSLVRPKCAWIFENHSMTGRDSGVSIHALFQVLNRLGNVFDSFLVEGG